MEQNGIETTAPRFEIVEALTRGEIDVQIKTAKAYPRSIAAFRRDAAALACLDRRTAEECRYVLPRGGKSIDGPGVRFAEIVASTWGNLRVATRIIGEDDTHITAQGVCFDLERNVAMSSEVQRRITDRDGRRYGDDMLVMTANAASAIAKRNAVFGTIPRAMWRPVWERILETIAGDKATLGQRRTELLDWFAGQGASRDRVLELLGAKGIDDIQAEAFLTLQGLRTAIEEGTTTVEDAFARAPAVATGQPVGQAAAEALAKSRADVEAAKAKRGRGRPKGAKNKPKADKPAQTPPDGEQSAEGNGRGAADETPEAQPSGDDGPSTPPGPDKLSNDLPSWRLLVRTLANRKQISMEEADAILATWFESTKSMRAADMDKQSLTADAYEEANEAIMTGTAG